MAPKHKQNNQISLTPCTSKTSPGLNSLPPRQHRQQCKPLDYYHEQRLTWMCTWIVFTAMLYAAMPSCCRSSRPYLKHMLGKWLPLQKIWCYVLVALQHRAPYGMSSKMTNLLHIPQLTPTNKMFKTWSRPEVWWIQRCNTNHAKVERDHACRLWKPVASHGIVPSPQIMESLLYLTHKLSIKGL